MNPDAMHPTAIPSCLRHMNKISCATLAHNLPPVSVWPQACLVNNRRGSFMSHTTGQNIHLMYIHNARLDVSFCGLPRDARPDPPRCSTADRIWYLHRHRCQRVENPRFWPRCCPWSCGGFACYTAASEHYMLFTHIIAVGLSRRASGALPMFCCVSSQKDDFTKSTGIPDLSNTCSVRPETWPTRRAEGAAG